MAISPESRNWLVYFTGWKEEASLCSNIHYVFCFCHLVLIRFGLKFSTFGFTLRYSLGISSKFIIFGCSILEHEVFIQYSISEKFSRLSGFKVFDIPITDSLLSFSFISKANFIFSWPGLVETRIQIFFTDKNFSILPFFFFLYSSTSFLETNETSLVNGFAM